MKYHLLVSSLTILISTIHCSDEVPVLAWGSGTELFNFHVPAHRKLSTSEFHENFVSKLVYNEPSAIIAFVEESLSPEDLSSQDTDEKSTYPFLQKRIESDSSAKYLPYVSNPVKAFQALDYTLHELPPLSSLQDLPNSKKVLILVNLNDAEDNEGRLKLLQRHDKVIHELCSKIQEKYEKAVCVLTAKRTSWIQPDDTSHPVRKLLQSESVPEDTETNTKDIKENLNVYYHENAGMIYTKNPPVFIVKSSNETFNLTLPANPAITKGNNALVVVLQTSKQPPSRVRLSLNFGNDNQTWQLSTIGVKYPVETSQSSQMNTSSYIGASLGNSFHTPSDVIFNSDNYQLTFNGLQVQYFTKSNEKRFGAAEDSVYFFTIPILSGLFVTSLLVTIVLIGLTMIFDIKTMDQFDDPKGKSITINASE